MHRQAVQCDLGEIQTGGDAQPQPNPSLDLLTNPQRVQRQVVRIREVLGSHHLDGPQRQVMCRTELALQGVSLVECAARAGIASSKLTAYGAAARNTESTRQIAFGEVGAELRDDHRRRRCQIVRVDDFQQTFAKVRKLGGDLELNTRRQEGKALHQPLDVGIGDLDTVHAQPSGDLWKLEREFSPHFAQVLQFLVVIKQQSRVHVSYFVMSRIWT